ncbi:hypothetical protein COL516b_010813 [Colletotrichum fioriniae]|nr:uncharacterized protein COL516b_010813 [Colletotrichum fioriniae]KAJ0297395.1 hypothetical protein COL516b_010813 [Colletotrichum fioriniae]
MVSISHTPRARYQNLLSPTLPYSVHADASNFANGVTKEEAYEQVLMQAEGLLDGQRNWVA